MNDNELLIKLILDGQEEVRRGLQEAKNEFTSVLDQINAKSRETQQTFRDIERVTRPIGAALVGLGAAGLAFADDVKKWNEPLGEFLEELRPVFVVMTAFGGLLLTVPIVVKGAVTAFNTLKIVLISLGAAAVATQAAFGLLTLGIGMIAAGISLLVTHGRHVEAVTAETERWGDTLGRTNDRLKELKEAGLGASDEAENLRRVMDDLIATYDVYNTIGEDNVVTIYNQADAEAKLAEYKEILTILEDKLIGRQTAANRATAIGIQQTENLEASIGNYKNTIVELTLGLLDLETAQEKATQAEIDFADATRDAAISDLEKQYGLRANATQSFIDLLNDETDARQDSLNDQLNDVRDNTNSVIAQYRKEYNEKVRLLDKETDAVVDSLQAQLDALEDAEEDASFEDEKARIEKELSEAWRRKDEARLNEELAKLVAKHEQDIQKKSLRKQIRDVQDAASDKKEQWQEELDANIENQNAILEASELAIGSQLDALETAMVAKRSILQQELNDAVAVQNAIRDNAIANINAVVDAQPSAANGGPVPLTTPGAVDYQSGVDYESWAALSMGGIRKYDAGGPVLEDSLLVGLRSGRPYAMAHQGEMVTPRGGDSITINVNGGVYREESDRRALAQEIGRELYRERQRRGSFGG